MKALQITRAIIPDELCACQVPEPEPAAGQVLVRLRAAALNHRDLNFFNWEPERPFILGSDGAGVLAAAGPGADGPPAGSEVVINPSLNWGEREDCYGPGWSILGWPTDGTLAEAIAVGAGQVFPKPAHLSFEEAAALPLAGLTAWRALVPRAQVQPGERVLIHGIGGGVALFALQFAVALGARVMVTSTSGEKLERARQLGAEAGVNAQQDDWAEKAREWSGGQGVDVVVESIGGDYLARSLPALRLGGRLVTFGATADKRATIAVNTLYWHQLTLLGTTMGSPRDFAAMLDFVNQHQLRPVVDSVRPLDDGCLAFQRLSRGEQFGKVVLQCAP
jgi:zinc-binding alcohol dehydrogenase/oxidoreductase